MVDDEGRWTKDGGEGEEGQGSRGAGERRGQRIERMERMGGKGGGGSCPGGFQRVRGASVLVQAARI